MKADDAATLRPGTVLRYRDFTARVTLDRRKDDDSGWWNTDGSGLADSALLSDDWSIADKSSSRALLEEVERLGTWSPMRWWC